MPERWPNSTSRSEYIQEIHGCFGRMLRKSGPGRSAGVFRVHSRGAFSLVLFALAAITFHPVIAADQDVVASVPDPLEIQGENPECNLTIAGFYSPYCGVCDVSVDGGPPASHILLTVPCGSWIELFAHEAPECRFYNWYGGEPCDGGCLPFFPYGSRMNPWWLYVDRSLYILLSCTPVSLAVNRQPEGADLYEGMRHRLLVDVGGNIGQAHFDWRKDGLSLDVADQGVLEITGASLADAGEYSCSVSDDYRSVQSESARIQVFPRASEGHHAADTDRNWQISLAELLRVVQFYNVGAFHCGEGTEDGYAPGPGETSCGTHSADFDTPDWRITMSELLRMVQFFNALGGAYHAEPGSEDGFAPGAG